MRIATPNKLIACRSGVKWIKYAYTELIHNGGTLPPLNPLGDRIRSLRKARSLTLDQLAEQSGSSKSYIWELENKNPPRPSADKIVKIAQALGTTIEHLLGGDEAQTQEDATDAHFYRNYQRMDATVKAKIRQIAELWGDDE